MLVLFSVRIDSPASAIAIGTKCQQLGIHRVMRARSWRPALANVNFYFSLSMSLTMPGRRRRCGTLEAHYRASLKARHADVFDLHQFLMSLSKVEYDVISRHVQKRYRVFYAMERRSYYRYQLPKLQVLMTCCVDCYAVATLVRWGVRINGEFTRVQLTV